jgi:hypothetical protein
MFPRSLRLLAALCLFGALHASAAVLYVDLNSTNPAPPFSSWATAATNIQDGVDAANAGDLILVTNGVYATGGVGLVFPSPPVGGPPHIESNRVAVLKAVAIQSVNGPSVTSIMGHLGDPAEGGLGTNAMRCAYLTNGASLSGFTLTGGATRIGGNGGGIYCFSNATVFNCLINNNLADNLGGGAYGGVLSNCTLNGNIACNGNGGGAALCTLNNCLVAGNQAVSFGGGAYSNTLNGCTVTNNSANSGAGAAFSTLNRCTLSGNSASIAGGGTYAGTLNNCLLTRNFATFGAGASGGTLNNCTIVDNSAAEAGGGVDQSLMTLNNCIIYNNVAVSSPNFYLGTLNYCCTTPLPNGPGNFTNDPLFVNPAAGDFHLQSNSPCINAGYNGYASTATDFDGNPRISGGTVDIGAYEFQNPASIISYAWLQQFGFATDGSADLLDPDHDGMNNWQEWLTGTDPTNPASVLQVLIPVRSGTNIVVTWQSVTNQTYYLLRAQDSQAPVFNLVAAGVPGQSGTTSYTDTNTPPPGPYFYRVAVVQPTGGPQSPLPWVPVPTPPPLPQPGH